MHIRMKVGWRYTMLMAVWKTETYDTASQVYRHPTDRLWISHLPPRTPQYSRIDASLPRAWGHPRYDTSSSFSYYFCLGLYHFLLTHQWQWHQSAAKIREATRALVLANVQMLYLFISLWVESK